MNFFTNFLGFIISSCRCFRNLFKSLFLDDGNYLHSPTLMRPSWSIYYHKSGIVNSWKELAYFAGTVMRLGSYIWWNVLRRAAFLVPAVVMRPPTQTRQHYYVYMCLLWIQEWMFLVCQLGAILHCVPHSANSFRNSKKK